MSLMRVLADGRLWYNVRGQDHSASVFWSLDADRRLVLDKCDGTRLATVVCIMSARQDVGESAVGRRHPLSSSCHGTACL